jgi:hypothetical protein
MKAFLFIFLLGIVLHASAKDPKFPAIEVSLHGSPAVRFSFSAADASSSSPVIISVPGRALTDECEYKRDGEFNGADHYVFEDAAGRQFHYYFYAGNWPLISLKEQ